MVVRSVSKVSKTVRDILLWLYLACTGAPPPPPNYDTLRRHFAAYLSAEMQYINQRAQLLFDPTHRKTTLCLSLMHTES